MKNLLWRCDDFGSATGANEAILRLARTGLVFNVSVLVCGPEARTSLAELVKLAPKVCLGIHAAINSEWDGVKWGPLAKATRTTGLVDADGYFHPDYEAAKNQPPEIIAAEVAAQIEQALTWAIPFSYLDEHMGFGWLPGVAPLLADLAARHGLVYRRELGGLPWRRTAIADLVERTRHQLTAVEDESPRLAIFHPAMDDASTMKFYHGELAPGVVSRERQAEFEALISDPWRHLVSGHEVQLVTYRDL